MRRDLWALSLCLGSAWCQLSEKLKTLSCRCLGDRSLPECTRAVFTFFLLPAASPLSHFLPVSPAFLPAHCLFSSFLPFCCWSPVAFPSCPSCAGTPFSFVRPHLLILGFLWFSLHRSVDGMNLGAYWGVEPRASCTLSTCYPTKPQHQPQ